MIKPECGDPAADNMVAVVVPAFNAAATIAATLRSVLTQTHAALEIVVVDDGSTDDTAAAALAAGRGDSRLRVLRRPNGGVAAARNAGIDATTAAFVATVDADDLWHPTKIEKQLRTLRDGGEGMAFVYVPFRRIDGEDRVLGNQRFAGPEGWIHHRHFINNVVGNGSSVLMRRAAIVAVGGYDEGFRARGLQGAEDWWSQMLMTRSRRVGFVREFLLGYRRGGATMSANKGAIETARQAVIAEAAALDPPPPPLLTACALAASHGAVARNLLRRGEIGAAAAALAAALRAQPGFATRRMTRLALQGVTDALRAMVEDAGRGRDFLSLDPRLGVERLRSDILVGPLRRLGEQTGPLDAPGAPSDRLRVGSDQTSVS